MNKLRLLLLFVTIATITASAQVESQIDAKTFLSRMEGEWKADTDQSTTSEMLPKLQEGKVSVELTDTGNSFLLESESVYLTAQGKKIDVNSAFFFAMSTDDKVYVVRSSADGSAGQTEGTFKDGKMVLSWEIPGDDQVDEARATLYFDTQGQLHYLQEFQLVSGVTLARKTVHVKQ